MAVRGIRGAIDVPENTQPVIDGRTQELLRAMVEATQDPDKHTIHVPAYGPLYRVPALETMLARGKVEIADLCDTLRLMYVSGISRPEQRVDAER